MSLPTRRLGPSRIAAIGFGCMNLNHAYGVPVPLDTAQTLLARALDLGITHFDTAALYGFGKNEAMLGELLAPVRRRIHLASKCGMQGVDGKRVIDGHPAALRKTLEDSLRRLRTDVIDLYYLHRRDRAVPIEDSIGALANFVREGKIRAIGVSELSAELIRRAHRIHPIAAVQSEYSLWSRNVEVAVLAECRQIGAAFVAFSPLARGFLTDSLEDPKSLQPGDLRRGMPRFNEPHWSANRALRSEFRRLAARQGVTSAQLALAWLLHKAPHIVPIPGTTSLAHLDENTAAANLALDPAVFSAAESIVNPRTVSGPRYPAATQAEIDTEELPVIMEST